MSNGASVSYSYHTALWRTSNNHAVERFNLDQLNKAWNATQKAITDKKKSSKGQDACEVCSYELLTSVQEELKEKARIESEQEVTKKQMVESEAQIQKKLNTIGNVIAPDVPVFKDEAHNVVVSKWGTPSTLVVDGKTLGHLHHHEIMQLLDIVELERG